MWKSIIYKEWIKTKWALMIVAGIGILAVGNIFLKVHHEFTFNSSNNYWFSILFNDNQFYNYGLFKFIPGLSGLFFAIAQFVPETANKRIKLTFHLPVNENRVLLSMILYGSICLLSVYLLILLIFWGLSIVYFPPEIIIATFITITPWFLCGFTAYFLAGLIILEPVWKYRLLYFLAGATFSTVYLEKAVTGANIPTIPILIFFSVALSISILFSGYRFRKGEM